jgi:hypothetical protein
MLKSLRQTWSLFQETDALSEVTKQNKKTDLEYESKSKTILLDYSLDSAESGISTFYKSIVDAPEYHIRYSNTTYRESNGKTKTFSFFFV